MRILYVKQKFAFKIFFIKMIIKRKIQQGIKS